MALVGSSAPTYFPPNGGHETATLQKCWREHEHPFAVSSACHGQCYISAHLQLNASWQVNGPVRRTQTLTSHLQILLQLLEVCSLHSLVPHPHNSLSWISSCRSKKISQDSSACFMCFFVLRPFPAECFMWFTGLARSQHSTTHVHL